MEHSLVQLADKFNWTKIDEICSAKFCKDNGRAGLPSRLVVGLLLLKQMNDLSDEEVCAKFIENPYFQYFCGNKYFEHKIGLTSESLTNWRKRLGAEVFQQILVETIALGLTEEVISPKELSEVISDTTVQEKNITYPTDGKLLCKALEQVVELGLSCGVKFRQTYKRTAPKLKNKAARLSHGRKPAQAQREIKRLRTLLGRVVRESERQINGLKNVPQNLLQQFKDKLSLAKRVFEQRRESKDKVYSMHEPEVSCIAKGKAHKKYEFGSKVGIISTIKNSFILAVDSFSGNPYDGKTLSSLLIQTELNTGKKISTVVLDKGYRGCKKAHPDIKVMLSGERNLSKSEKKKLNQRSKIEPTIGLMKSKCRMDLNRLKGCVGDKLNAILAAIAYNLRMILRGIFYFIIYCLFLHNIQRNYQLEKINW
jgi:IS5 family transposase